MEAAKAALEKRARGETLKRGEIIAINRYEKMREAGLRAQYLTDCPQGTVEEMFGVSRKTMLVLKKEGLPFRRDGRRLSFNLYEVGCWMWDRFRSRGALDRQGGGARSSPAYEELQVTKAARAKWDFEVEQKKWTPIDEMERREVEIATAVRRAFEQLGRELAPKLVAKGRAQEVRRIIDDLVEARLKQLSGRKV